MLSADNVISDKEGQFNHVYCKRESLGITKTILGMLGEVETMVKEMIHG